MSLPLALAVFALGLALHTDPDGTSLARRIRDGDREAFRTFFDRHHGTLLGYVRSRGVPPDVAEDLVQNAFVYVWTHRDAIDPDRSLRSYLFRIGYTRALNHFRDTDRLDHEADWSTTGNPDDAATPEDDTLTAELRGEIDAAIAELPERRRAAFELCFLQGFTYKEAADVLEVTRKTVENHMSLALKDLRDALGDWQ